MRSLNSFQLSTLFATRGRMKWREGEKRTRLRGMHPCLYGMDAYLALTCFS